MAGALGLIVKATRLCNLRCTYCHDWRTGPGQTMSFEVMARMTASALETSGPAGVDFIWHGGEPTVVGMPFYEKALYVQAQFQRSGQRISNSFQTNATLLTDRWLRFLKDSQFAVSVSLDGPSGIQSANRPWASGRSSFPETVAGIRRLRDAGIPFSVLMVVDEPTLELGAERFFEFLVAEQIHSVALLAAAPVNRPHASPVTATPHYVDPVRMTSFLARLYDQWLAHGDSGMRVREFEGLTRRLDRQPANVCTLAGACVGRYYSVEPNGDVAHCDLYVGDTSYTFGNLRDQGFADFERHPRVLELQQQNVRALDRMRTCPEFGVCNGWCPHERYLSERHQPGYTGDCCGLRGLIEHMRTAPAHAAHRAALTTASA
jgi:uncharacterized protein